MNKRQKYQRSKKGLVNTMHHRQRQSSIKRGHPAPAYTCDDLMAWVFAQANFIELYAAWVASDYNKWLIPSIDRLEDNKPYTFGNIQLITWKENYLKSHTIESSIRARKTTTQYTLEGMFIAEHESLCNAARAIGKPDGSGSDISRVATGKQKTAYGFM